MTRLEAAKYPARIQKGQESSARLLRGARVLAGGWCGLAPHYNSQFMILDTVNGHNKASPTIQPAV